MSNLTVINSPYTEPELDVLEFLNFEWCYPYKYLEAETGRDRKELEKAVKRLREMKLVTYLRGLMDEEGMVAGSGFHLNSNYREEIRQILDRRPRPTLTEQLGAAKDLVRELENTAPYDRTRKARLVLDYRNGQVAGELKQIRTEYDDLEFVDQGSSSHPPKVTWQGWKMVRNVITERIEQLTGSRS